MFDTFEQSFEGNFQRPGKLCKVLGNFQCDLCSFSSSLKDVITRHIKIHQTKKCKECGAVFPSKLMVSRLKRKECVLCLTEFRCRTSLNKHINDKHRDERGYFFCPSDGCRSSTKSLNSLQEHLRRVHGKTRECDHCDSKSAV